MHSLAMHLFNALCVGAAIPSVPIVAIVLAASTFTVSLCAWPAARHCDSESRRSVLFRRISVPLRLLVCIPGAGFVFLLAVATFTGALEPASVQHLWSAVAALVHGFGLFYFSILSANTHRSSRQFCPFTFCCH